MNHYASHKTVIRRSHEPSNGRALNFIVNHQHIINTLLILYQHSINTVSMHGSHNPQKMVFTWKWVKNSWLCSSGFKQI